MSERGLLDFKVDVPVESIPVGEAATAFVQNMMAAETFELVVGFATAHALLTLGSCKVLPDLQRDGWIDIPSAAAQYELQHRHLVGLFRFLATQDYCKEQIGEVFHLTPKGRAAVSRPALGWIQMMVGGYGNLMVDANRLINGELTYGKDITRNPLAVSRGSSMSSSSIIDEVPFRVIERYGIHRIVDLGCGTGGLLMAWARRNPNNRGIGVDIAPEAIEAATAAAKEAGVADRIRFVCADGGDMKKVAEACREADLIYSFALEHELLARGDQFVIDHLNELGALFPGMRYLVGEPALNMTKADGPFYWVHVLSHQGFPKNVPGWCEFFKRVDNVKLERVYLPDHQRVGMYFDLLLGSR
jgi:SAM-dependent methyltransferase